jgi:hypothetical protein
MQPYPFPLDSSFERRLFEAAPLTGIDFTNATKWFGFAFGHIVGSLMHIATISCPDSSYCVMRYYGYMACPNLPIFEALHLTMCYLYHHPHLPIMYPSKPMKQSSATLQTHWKHGFAEYISSDFGDGLTTFADADFAHDLRSRRSAFSMALRFIGVARNNPLPAYILAGLNSILSTMPASNVI